jgi:hypothetical protein
MELWVNIYERNYSPAAYGYLCEDDADTSAEPGSRIGGKSHHVVLEIEE